MLKAMRGFSAPPHTKGYEDVTDDVRVLHLSRETAMKTKMESIFSGRMLPLKGWYEIGDEFRKMILATLTPILQRFAAKIYRELTLK